MKAQHISHKSDEWFDIVGEDPDCDFDTGKYIGLHDNLKFCNGHWYPKSECVYKNADDIVASCAS